MLILAGQLAMSLAVIAFALVALRVAAAMPHHVRHFSYAWAFTGWTFLIEGSNALLHDVFSIIGFLSGPGSGAWEAVIRWHPVLNHSRTFLLTTYCVVLAIALHRIARETPPPRLDRALWLVALGMVIGGLVGWQEADFSGYTHFSAVAIFDIMELAAVMALLLVGVMSGAVDRALWVALGINGFVLAYSVLLFAALAAIEFKGQWAPPPLYGQWTKAVLQTVMVLVAAWHLRKIRQGREVRSLVDRPRGATGIPSLRL